MSCAVQRIECIAITREKLSIKRRRQSQSGPLLWLPLSRIGDVPLLEGHRKYFAYIVLRYALHAILERAVVNQNSDAVAARRQGSLTATRVRGPPTFDYTPSDGSAKTSDEKRRCSCNNVLA